MTKGIIKKIMIKKDSEIDLNKIIDHIYEGQFRSNTKEWKSFTKKKTFGPSTLVYGQGHCARYWYLAFEGNEWENKNTGKNYATMNSGSDRHTRLQEALKEAGVLEWSEKTVTYSDPPIYGFADAMVNIDENKVLLEIKTTTDESYRYHVQSNSASRYHIEQLLIYMKILKQQVGAIVYENKNTNEILVIPVVAKQEHIDFINYLFDWMRKVKKAFDDKQLPERGYRQNSKICKGCPVEKVCDSREKGDIKIERRKELG